MSMPRFSIEHQTPAGYKYGLALRLLEEVAPTILSINNPLTRRVAIAYSWYIFLTQMASTICRLECGEEFENDYKKWGEEELDKIAKALTIYASHILKEVLQGGDRPQRINPPRPPSSEYLP